MTRGSKAQDSDGDEDSEALLTWVDPDSQLFDPDSLLIDPDSLLIDPDSLLIDPDSLLIDPDSLLVDPDSLLVDPGSLLVQPRGSSTHRSAGGGGGGGGGCGGGGGDGGRIAQRHAGAASPSRSAQPLCDAPRCSAAVPDEVASPGEVSGAAGGGAPTSSQAGGGGSDSESGFCTPVDILSRSNSYQGDELAATPSAPEASLLGPPARPRTLVERVQAGVSNRGSQQPQRGARSPTRLTGAGVWSAPEGSLLLRVEAMEALLPRLLAAQETQLRQQQMLQEPLWQQREHSSEPPAAPRRRGGCCTCCCVQ